MLKALDAQHTSSFDAFCSLICTRVSSVILGTCFHSGFMPETLRKNELFQLAKYRWREICESFNVVLNVRNISNNSVENKSTSKKEFCPSVAYVMTKGCALIFTKATGHFVSRRVVLVVNAVHVNWRVDTFPRSQAEMTNSKSSMTGTSIFLFFFLISGSLLTIKHIGVQ